MRAFRYRLTTLFVVVAVVALCLIVGPRLWHRHRVNQAAATILEQGPDLYWSIDPFSSPTNETLFLLLTDLDRALGKFSHVLEDDTAEFARQKNAAEMMELLLARSGSAEIRARWQQHVLKLVVGTRRYGSHELLLELLADWIPATGVSEQERCQLLAAARRHDFTVGWAELLIAMGGREEILLVLQHGGTHDQDLLWAIHNSYLLSLRWPGLLPYLEKWLEDPIVAECRVLDYGILTSNPRGRQLLLAYALDHKHPQHLRRQALDRLLGSRAGIELLETALLRPETATALNDAFGGYPECAFWAARANLKANQAERFWLTLIHGLDMDYWFPNTRNRAIPPEAQKQYDVLRKQSSTGNLRCLQKLTGRADLTTEKEWKEWYRNARPRVITQAEIIQAVIEDPQLLATSEIMRRIVPWHLGAIPDDCMPLYKQLLRNGTPSQKYWASQPLLALSNDLEAVPVAIELLQFSGPSEVSSQHPGEVDLLRSRFAENFFWEVEAWQEWWNEYQKEQELIEQ